MCLRKHKKGRFGIEICGYLAKLQVKECTNKLKICLVSGDHDCLTIGDIIKAAGYDPESLKYRRLLITIEDEV